jgi:hypothetical protein
MKKFLFLLFTFFPFLSSADINDDKVVPFCGIVSDEIQKFHGVKNSGSNNAIPLSYYTDFGIKFHQDFDKYIDYYQTEEYKNSGKRYVNYEETIYKRKNNNLIINLINKDVSNIYGLKNNAEIISINGTNTSDLTDYEIYKFEYDYDNEELEIEFKNSNEDDVKKINLKKNRYEALFLTTSIKEDLISDIDSKKSQHTSNLHLQISYSLSEAHPLTKLVKKLYVRRPPTHNYRSRSGFNCTFYNDEAFNELGLYNPDIQLTNQVNNLAEVASERTYYVNFSYSRDDFSSLIIYKIIDYKNLNFQNNFKFQSFPFDAQALKYELLFQSSGYNIFPLAALGDYEFLGNIKTIDLNEWEHSGADYKLEKVFDSGYDNYGISYYHFIERNYSYYVSKIILPILIILLISWSVFWIHPKELEARLTVSIVCLLSLIAYTFIIDKDIPKLSYLTLMDYVVLISYFFSIIPTLQTIFVHNYINKLSNHADLEDAKRYDKKCRKYVPFTYFLLLIIIFLDLVSKTPNTVKGISSFIS